MKSTFQIIHIIGAIQGLFLFILLIMRKENKTANKILAFLILMTSINLMLSFFHENNMEINDFLAINRSDFFVFSYGPLILYYVLFLTACRYKLKFLDVLNLSPSIILLFLLFLSFTRIGDPTLSSLWSEDSPTALKMWYLTHLSALLHLLVYLLLSMRALMIYKSKLASYFSQTGKIYLSWLSALLSALLFIWTLSIVQFLLNIFKDPEGIIQWSISISMVAFLFAIGYYTNRQPDILDDLKDIDAELSGEIAKCAAEAIYEKPQKPAPDARYEKSRLGEAKEKGNLDRLLNYMKDEQPYLEPDLNLKKLAEGVGLPSHQISMLLSIYLNRNFYDFINCYRVDEAKRRLAAHDSKEHNILTIAFDTGFNSKTTFNTVFKKLVGITPSQYRLQQQKENIQL